MSASIYDRAILERIRSWVGDVDISVLKPGETARLFEKTADQKSDKPIRLPLIALSREVEMQILNPHRQPKTYDGHMIRAYDDDGREVHLDNTFKLNAIPVRLGYQLDIITKKLSEADEYVREFMFRLINKPRITIEIPYRGLHLTHVCNVRVDPNVVDNSDIPQRAFPTQFTRLTMSLYIDDAYIFSVDKKDNLSIDGIELETYLGDAEGHADGDTEETESFEVADT